MDTDSLFISLDDLSMLQQQYPDLYGSEYGQYDLEMEEAYDGAGLEYHTSKTQTFFMLAPKCYRVVDVQSKVAVKTRFKGVGWNERMLTKDSPVALLQWAGL